MTGKLLICRTQNMKINPCLCFLNEYWYQFIWNPYSTEIEKIIFHKHPICDSFVLYDGTPIIQHRQRKWKKIVAHAMLWIGILIYTFGLISNEVWKCVCINIYGNLLTGDANALPGRRRSLSEAVCFQPSR
jgi:hypothetical protein